MTLDERLRAEARCSEGGDTTGTSWSMPAWMRVAGVGGWLLGGWGLRLHLLWWCEGQRVEPLQCSARSARWLSGGCVQQKASRVGTSDCNLPGRPCVVYEALAGANIAHLRASWAWLPLVARPSRAWEGGVRRTGRAPTGQRRRLLLPPLPGPPPRHRQAAARARPVPLRALACSWVLVLDSGLIRG